MSQDQMHEEFLSEAQEIIDSISRDLLVLEHDLKESKPYPGDLASIFRGVHTLKGIAGMFGQKDLAEVSHLLEDLLDHLRLGKLSITQKVLNVLFEGVETLQRIVAAVKDEKEEIDWSQFRLSLIDILSQHVCNSDDQSPLDIELGSDILEVLTQEEEYRLRVNVKLQVPLYIGRIHLPLDSIQKEIDKIKTALKPVCEIIAYSPSTKNADDSLLEFEFLLASKAHPEEILEKVPNLSLDPIKYKKNNLERTVPPPADHISMMENHADAMLTIEQRNTQTQPKIQAEGIRNKPSDNFSKKKVSSHLSSPLNRVKVDIAKLDHLMNLSGELWITQRLLGRLIEQAKGNFESQFPISDLERIHRSLGKHLTSLQNSILSMRMVPIGQTFDRLARAIREAAREQGKEVRFIPEGAKTEIDKLVAEELLEPLLHIVRNAVSHGIENREERIRLGKNPEGVVRLRAHSQGNRVVIEIEDDGAGIDCDRVLARALEKQLITMEQAKALDERAIQQLIFLPGFSTAEQVSKLSGRGVGLDVVKASVSKVGGAIDLFSVPKKGTKFVLILPVTLALVSALLLRVGTQYFAIPIGVVEEVVRFDEHSLQIIDGRLFITLRGKSLLVVRLSDVLGIFGENGKFIVVVSIGKKRVGFIVDDLEGQRNIVSKPLGPSLGHVRGFAGAADLGDQRVVLLLDAPTLVSEVVSLDYQIWRW